MNRIFYSFVALISVVMACSSDKVNIMSFEPARSLGKVDDPYLREVSGITASETYPGFYWVNNDSGDSASVYLIDSTGRLRTIASLEGALNRDWEDITSGPGPIAGKPYIYVGDIGDNHCHRDVKKIYRFCEPENAVADSVCRISVSAIDTIRYRYDGKKQNCETMMLDPLTKDIYLVSKGKKQETLYVLPYPQSVIDTMTAKAVAVIPVVQATGGNISPDGSEILIKNYHNIYYWKRNNKRNIADVLTDTAMIVPYIGEPLGEAVTFSADGSGYLTVSEKHFFMDTIPDLYFYKRKRR